MKKIVTIVLMAAGLIAATSRQAKAQSKIGYISLQEVIAAMPETKKADSALQDFQNALAQNFEDAKKEFTEQDSLLLSKDTAKYTKAQLELKRKSLQEKYVRLQGYNQQASQQMQQKQQDLIAPIQKKAQDAIQAVAKESGYTYVLNKEALFAFPTTDDLLPLVKKKLGVK